MLRGIMLSLMAASMVLSEPAIADESGFFAGVDAFGTSTRASSNTRNGGAAFAGGGVVKNVDFDGAAGIGGHAGYRFDSAWSAFASYGYSRGDVSWDAVFPAFGVASSFSGSATTQMVLGNVAYDFAITPKATASISAGAGIAFNALSDVVERDKPTSLFLSDVKNHTQASPVVRIGVGYRYRVTRHVVLGADAAVARMGGFRTGDTRSGNLGVTDITPYRMHDAWQASLGASMRILF